MNRFRVAAIALGSTRPEQSNGSSLPPDFEPMHVAILVSGLGAGGAELVIAQIARHWCAAGHRVSVIAFDRPQDPVYHALPQAVALHRLGIRTGKRGVAGRIAGVRRIVQDQRPAVLVSFLTKNNVIAAMATLGADTRLVCAERNNPERQDAHPGWNWALKTLYRRADAIVCQTDAVRRCFPAAVRRRLVTIPNPVAPPDVLPGAEDIPQIVAVGRLTHQKGFDVLLRAFARIAPRFPQWRLTIWGDGADRETLERAAAGLGLHGRVALPGISPVPRDWIREGGLFVMPSRYEGFPNVLGEAMAAGLPVIAADCDFGPAEMVEDGVTGLLVPPEDAEALAEAMATLMAQSAMRRGMGAAGAQSMARYAPERVLALWDRLLVRVMAKRDEARRYDDSPSARPANAAGARR